MAILATNGYQALAMDLPGRPIINTNASDNKHDNLETQLYTIIFYHNMYDKLIRGIYFLPNLCLVLFLQRLGLTQGP